MIQEWIPVGFHAIWILGVSILLVVLSWGYFNAQTTGKKLRIILTRPNYQFAFLIALILFSFGLAGSTSSTLERILWLLLTLAWLVQAIFAVLQGNKKV